MHAMALVFDRTFDAPAGEPVRLSLSVQRLLADNPGPYTFKGTGVYIIGAHDVAVIDPGPATNAHLDALKFALMGLKVTHILVTHTHTDHSAAAPLVKEWTGAAIYAFGPHPAAHDADGFRFEEGADRDFVPDVCLKHGDVIETGGLTIDCLHTPGHLANHMCFALREEKALFTGDHVMGWSTTMISPPEGDMADYMESLRLLIGRRDRVLYPTHGAPIKEPRPYLESLLAHRLRREAEILYCLGKGIGTVPAIVERLYADIDKTLLPAASRSVLAHLVKLEREGRAKAGDGGHYRLA
jgi:glyoxylase-like metal-dependent hydrolase (beta-lactamase superfamily II)